MPIPPSATMVPHRLPENNFVAVQEMTNKLDIAVREEQYM